MFKTGFICLRVQLTFEDSPFCKLDPEKEEEAPPFWQEHGVGTNRYLTLRATSNSVMQRWNHESCFLCVNIYIPDSPTWPRSLFSDSRWHLPLFPGSPAARPSAPPSPSSPLACPPGLRPCLPAPATCLSREFTHVDEKENKRRKRESVLASSPSLLFITEMERLSSAMAWPYCRFKPWVSPRW